MARANVAVLTHPQAPSGAFNVATGEPHTVLDMAGALPAAFGPGVPAPEVTGGSGPVTCAMSTPRLDRARRVLGFSSEVGFAAGHGRVRPRPVAPFPALMRFPA